MTGGKQWEVTLPAGGTLQLLGQEEVEMWETADERYRRDYALNKTNDLVLLGSILTQQLALFRAQQRINGMFPVLDANKIPTGEYRQEPLKATEMKAAQDVVIKASKEIRELETTLGIDKKTRDQGGQQNTAQYLEVLKRAASEYGVHISKRTLAYEEFAMALRTKIRVLRNADAEDRAYENVTPESIIEYCEQTLRDLEDIDKRYAKEKGKLYVGRL